MSNTSCFIASRKYIPLSWSQKENMYFCIVAKTIDYVRREIQGPLQNRIGPSRMA